ncbi:MAG TPA: hypothetical protein VFG45_13630 [Candidatus Nitrosocosmicus sp.]|nr:hypothetical protein [Candidatus Nitrosocosmicus sp.]
MVTSSPEPSQGKNSTTGKHIIQEDKADEVKALIARYVLLKIEQKKIEANLSEIAKYYDNESLRTIFEPIGESMMRVIGLELPHNRKK